MGGYMFQKIARSGLLALVIIAIGLDISARFVFLD